MTKKEKLLAEAQKLQQKGLSDKAVACYREVLSAEPGDMRVRQRLAELLAKCRRIEEARKEFETIGRNLTAGGFYLKAIAVYKQIEKLCPDDVGIVVTLASLNEQHGLPANALTEYKRAYEQFERLKSPGEALKALEAMQRIDSRNPSIKLKYAEVLYQQQKRDEAFDSFVSLGGLLIERHDVVAFGRLAERVAQLFQERSNFVDLVLEQKLRDGAAEAVAALLQVRIKAAPQRYADWKMLLQAYRELGNVPRLKAICQHCVKQFPSELYPRELLISCLLDEQQVQAALDLLDESESHFVAAGAALALRDYFLRLNELVPLNIRIMKGCARFCQLTGNPDEAAAFAAKIGSLAGLGGGQAAAVPANEPEAVELLEVEPLEEDGDSGAGFETPITIRHEETRSASEPQPKTGPRELDLHDFSDTAAPAENSFYEIEVELDDDWAGDGSEPAETWFETVHDIFGTITTETGKVRYGEGLENGDSQSQFDLGSAFYEMGLFDEAINILRQAAEDPARRVASLTLQGACLREKGELALAVNALQAVLALPGLTVEDSCALKYELALTFAAQGDEEQARRCFAEIQACNPTFRDVGTRLQGGSAAGFDFDEDDLLDFELK